MNISENTIKILKNFASINANILVKEGNELNTISTMRNIIAKATITETFDSQFGIYDLNEFLSVHDVLNKPELKLDDSSMIIKDEGGKVKYFYADPSVLVKPTKEVKMPEADVTFELTQTNLNKIMKMAAILKAPDLALEGTIGGPSVLKVCDKKNVTGNTYDITVSENATADYTFYFQVDNMKMIEGDYDVSIASKSIAHFKNKKEKIEYWIALEQDSTISK